jgi:hypothetical protein
VVEPTPTEQDRVVTTTPKSGLMCQTHQRPISTGAWTRRRRKGLTAILFRRARLPGDCDLDNSSVSHSVRLTLEVLDLSGEAPAQLCRALLATHAFDGRSIAGMSFHKPPESVTQLRRESDEGLAHVVVTLG